MQARYQPWYCQTAGILGQSASEEVPLPSPLPSLPRGEHRWSTPFATFPSTSRHPAPRLCDGGKKRKGSCSTTARETSPTLPHFTSRVCCCGPVFIKQEKEDILQMAILTQTRRHEPRPRTSIPGDPPPPQTKWRGKSTLRCKVLIHATPPPLNTFWASPIHHDRHRGTCFLYFTSGPPAQTEAPSSPDTQTPLAPTRSPGPST